MNPLSERLHRLVEDILDFGRMEAAAREYRLQKLDPATLVSMIDALPIGGNTASDLGMKWGVALLDPAMAPVVDSLIADGEADAMLAQHPLPYEDGDVLKVVVL